ncbi:hypothetical protein [Embleya hyalina]|uniref:Uncharacterized protein n=1 Tax=Embleya hyalina TaxID=516124 RepID=A0A401YEV0_9ACTN|nr:hypothetical protein [Embleya hyalina]GCD93088.1 hypothetical protein EHYA_00731 [Embleya hyalina]
MRGATVRDEVRRALPALWSVELTELLRRDSAGREELARLTREIADALPIDRRPIHYEHNNTAHDFGTTIAVRHGEPNMPRTKP